MDMNHTNTTAFKCKISMTWNWYTIDACFIHKGWRIYNKSNFAGTCIGVFLLVVVLEAIRRLQREYDRYIIREWQNSSAADQQNSQPAADQIVAEKTVTLGAGMVKPLSFRPNILQQFIRAFLYLAQFVNAYFVMLLAMYYNGYVIISIFLGAFFGHLIFGYDNIIITGKQETGTSCC